MTKLSITTFKLLFITAVLFFGGRCIIDAGQFEIGVVVYSFAIVFATAAVCVTMYETLR